jgi:hypothetical protein
VRIADTTRLEPGVRALEIVYVGAEGAGCRREAARRLVVSQAPDVVWAVAVGNEGQSWDITVVRMRLHPFWEGKIPPASHDTKGAATRCRCLRRPF